MDSHEVGYRDAVALLVEVIDTAPEGFAGDYEAAVEVLLDSEVWIPMAWRLALIESGRRHVEGPRPFEAGQ